LSVLNILILSVLITWAVPPSASGQAKRDLTIRVLNARSGKPLKSVRVWLHWLKGPILPVQKTNDDGLVIFGLPDVPPGTLGLLVNSFE
jgi:hypothetical protein